MLSSAASAVEGKFGYEAFFESLYSFCGVEFYPPLIESLS
jgi:hypothetical protein